MCWHRNAQLSHTRQSSVIAQTLKSSLKYLCQFGMHYSCFQSKSAFLRSNKCECLDLSGLPVQCHTIPLLTRSPFLNGISCTLSPRPRRPKMLSWKETIRPQSSADTENRRRPPFPFIFFSVLYVLCTVIPLSCTSPMNKLARRVLLCPAPQSIPAAL